MIRENETPQLGPFLSFHPLPSTTQRATLVYFSVGADPFFSFSFAILVRTFLIRTSIFFWRSFPANN